VVLAALLVARGVRVVEVEATMIPQPMSERERQMLKQIERLQATISLYQRGSAESSERPTRGFTPSADGTAVGSARSIRPHIPASFEREWLESNEYALLQRAERAESALTALRGALEAVYKQWRRQSSSSQNQLYNAVYGEWRHPEDRFVADAAEAALASAGAETPAPAAGTP
jgi:hypothetical protein